ncbi:MAG: hypothetical protein K2W95_24840 [Candidatus Obscuribacterales bacterium]|nr:hypothetical protein [Candidatus Obscuribacterales bacterium]
MADSEILRAGDLRRLADDTADSTARSLLHDAGTIDRAPLPGALRRPEPTSVELPSPFGTRDTLEAARTAKVERSLTRRNDALAEEAKDGEKRVSTLKLDEGSVTTEVIRLNGKIQELRLLSADGKEGLHLVRDAASGKMKIDGPVDANAMKTLSKLGVKVGKDGTIQGEIELTAKGDLKYTDAPGSPKRIVTQLNTDGSSSRTDIGRYIRTERDAQGNETATKGWNGRSWAAIRKEDIAETKSADGTTAKTSLTFRNPNGTIAKTVDRTVGTAEGDNRNIAAFTYPGGGKRTYDWNNTLCRDDKTNKVSGKDAFGKYTESRENWARTLPDGGKEYRKDGCTVAKDKEHRITSVATADQAGVPGKKLDLKHDAHGDVKSVTIGGKTYDRVGPEKNPGAAFHLGRGEKEAAFKASDKFNKWVCREDKSTKDFNIGITESGKILLTTPGGKAKDYDLAKGGTKEKSGTLDALGKDLSDRITDLPRRAPERETTDRSLLSGIEKIKKGLEAPGRKLDDVLSSLSKQEQASLYKAMGAIAGTDVRMLRPQEMALARSGIDRMLHSARPNPLDAIFPREAQAVRQMLRRVSAGRR